MNINIVRDNMIPGTIFAGTSKPTGHYGHGETIRKIVDAVQDAKIETRIRYQLRVHFIEKTKCCGDKPGSMTLKGFAHWADRIVK